MSEFDPIILHRVQPYLMDFSIEHDVVVPAACGFPTLVTPPAQMVGHMVNNRLELECPTCADIADAQRALKERFRTATNAA